MSDELLYSLKRSAFYNFHAVYSMRTNPVLRLSLHLDAIRANLAFKRKAARNGIHSRKGGVEEGGPLPFA